MSAKIWGDFLGKTLRYWIFTAEDRDAKKVIISYEDDRETRRNVECLEPDMSLSLCLFFLFDHRHFSLSPHVDDGAARSGCWRRARQGDRASAADGV